MSTMRRNQVIFSDILKNYFNAEIVHRIPVSGGDINKAYMLLLSDGKKVFMKTNRKENEDFFRAEKDGVEAIKKTETINVPRIYDFGSDEKESFLLMEYIESGRKQKHSSEELGIRLAKMHQSDAGGFVEGGKYGFLHDNYIGCGYQNNEAEDSWIDFFIHKRLQPQFEKAGSYWNREDRRRIDRFLGKVREYLEEPDKPSLLHGDLWSGNYMIDQKGNPWLIDPAVYVGHAEADLAMTELFGGFDESFYASYREIAGIDPYYKDRKEIYNLYHLLNHLNMFGGTYLHSVRNIFEKYS